MSNPLDNRVAFVAEDVESDDVGRYSGRFSAHWEDPETREGSGEGPEYVSIDEALAWARSNSDVVYVIVGDSPITYSAGRRHPDPSAPRWPTAGVVVEPRPIGTPDDGREQSATFRMRATLSDLHLTRTRRADLLRRLSGDAQITDVSVVEEGATSVVLSFAIRSRGLKPAVLESDHLLEATLRRLAIAAAVEIEYVRDDPSASARASRA